MSEIRHRIVGWHLRAQPSSHVLRYRRGRSSEPELDTSILGTRTAEFGWAPTSRDGMGQTNFVTAVRVTQLV